MTVPVTGSTNAVVLDATNTFNTQITDVVNAIVKWTNTSGAYAVIPSPLPTRPSGWTQTNTVTGYTPTSLNPQLLPGQMVASSAAINVSIATTANLSVSVLSTLLINSAKALSRCRLVNFKQYYQDDNTSNQLLTNVTDEAHMQAAYQLGSIAATLAGGDVDASLFNTFIGQLSTAVTNHRNTTLFFSEQWCHTSCHSSHSSRSRR